MKSCKYYSWNSQGGEKMSKACIGCKKRYTGCHGECPAYKKYKKKNDTIREKRLKEYGYKDYIANKLWHEKRI